MGRWFQKILRTSYLEITVVGDRPAEEILRCVGEVFGSMPVREDFPRAWEKKRILSVPGPERRHFHYRPEGSRHPVAELHLFWPGLPEDNIELQRRQQLLAEVLSGRLMRRVRHDLGEAYSPYAHYLQSDAFPAYRWMHVGISVDPKKVAAVESAFLQEVEQLLRDGISPEEFRRVVEPGKNAVRDLRRKNAYWLQVLSRSQADGRSLACARSLEDFYPRVSREDLEWVARRVLKKELLYRYVLRPDGVRKRQVPREALRRHRPH